MLQELHSQVSAEAVCGVHCAAKKAESLGIATPTDGHHLWV